MFKTHQTKISKWAMRSVDNTAKVCLLVSATIQTQTPRVFDEYRDILAKGKASPYCWGMKEQTYDYVMQNKKQIYRVLKDAKLGKIKLVDCLVELSRMDGIGLAKAGFIMQLCIGEVGCMDTHNLQRFGLEAKTFKFGKTASDKLRRMKAELYIQACEEQGGCEYLWNSWCELIGTEKFPELYGTGEAVSKLHCDWLGIKA